VFAQACQNQLAHTNDGGSTARRHVQPAEQFLPGRLYGVCEQPLGIVIRAVGIVTGGGG
jgi:hypothetical protein